MNKKKKNNALITLTFLQVYAVVYTYLLLYASFDNNLSKWIIISFPLIFLITVRNIYKKNIRLSLIKKIFFMEILPLVISLIIILCLKLLITIF